MDVFPVVGQTPVERNHLRDELFKSVVFVHGLTLGHIRGAEQGIVQGHPGTHLTVGVV